VRALVPRSEPVSGKVAVVVGRLSDEGGTRAGQSLELRRRSIGPVALGLASRRPWRWDSPQGFQHGGKQGGRRGPRSRVQIALRAKRFGSLLRGPPWHSPVFSVLNAFLDCGRHMFPRLSEATADSSDCPGAGFMRACWSCSPRRGGDDYQGLGLGIVRGTAGGGGIGTTGPAMPLGVRGWTGPVAVGSG
jgi:hypothetical protein